jgi:hypothetical protein
MAATDGGPAWHLQPGDSIERKELHALYGGRTQGGIGPSKRSPNVFIFTDPIAEERHGIFDGWMPDGLFHYSGEGQYGDQRMLSGNASILNHRAEGRALRVFQGVRGLVTYLGEFEVDPEYPWYEADAPEVGDGPIRKIIVFRLRPVDARPQPPQTRLARLLADTTGPIQDIPIEAQLTERTFISPNRETYEAERREAQLVQDFAAFLRSRGHTVVRQQILPPGETRPLLTDLYDIELGLLVEAKGSVTRENIRMALGQLADYGRFLPESSRAVLVPTRPRQDLLALASSLQTAFIWPAADDYYSTDSKISEALGLRR